MSSPAAPQRQRTASMGGLATRRVLLDTSLVGEILEKCARLSEVRALSGCSRARRRVRPPSRRVAAMRGAPRAQPRGTSSQVGRNMGSTESPRARRRRSRSAKGNQRTRELDGRGPESSSRTAPRQRLERGPGGPAKTVLGRRAGDAPRALAVPDAERPRADPRARGAGGPGRAVARGRRAPSAHGRMRARPSGVDITPVARGVATSFRRTALAFQRCKNDRK